eukprot:TRINITY_DN21880_c2_g1_i1.p2 TRINITY_DN21880_c2_g1~~TRINITY_DN21880_c2_g1_i1.p2  ORF type:complete len:537 (+),score=220.30 TRINITY_DN21880_c2_g1_i1:103-1611(+)
MYYDASEMEREAWRHQQCAEYLRTQLQQGGSPGPAPPGYAGGAATAGGSPSPSGAYGYGQGYSQQPSPQRYATGAGQPQQGQPQGPAAVGHQDKVWKTFNDLDANRNGRVELDEMLRGFRDINLELTDATTEDLYKKAKRPGDTSDGIVNAEWGDFCQRYPMLRDAIYFRFLAKQNADQDLREATQLKAELQRSRDRAQQEADGAEREAQAERNAAQREEEALKDSDAAQREAEDQASRAEQAAREAARKRDSAHAKVQREWPVIQRRQAERFAAQQDAEVARRRIGEAEERERMLQQALDDARQEKERALAALRDANDREAASRPAEGEPDPEEEFHAAERALGDAHRGEQDARGTLSDAQSRSDRQRARRDEQDRRAENAEQRRDAARHGLQRAQKNCDDNEQRIRNAEGTQKMGPGKAPDGGMTEDGRKENQLVQEEIRLREQRDNLEQREGVLREEHTSWVSPRQEQLSALARGSPAAAQQHGSPQMYRTSGSAGAQY